MSDVFIVYFAFSYISMSMFSACLTAPILVRVSSVLIAPITLPIIFGGYLSRCFNDM